MQPKSLKARSMLRYSAVLVPLFVTTTLWLYAKVDSPQILEFSNLPLLLSQMFSLWGIVLLAINYLIPTRFRFIEKIYGGLDKSYILHKYIGKFAFILIWAHPILLIAQYFGDTDQLLSFLFPLIGSTTMTKSLGVLSIYLYSVIVLISIVKIMSYEKWKLIHKFSGLAFIIASYHALTAESDVKYYLPLTVWIGFWIVLGTISYIYKLLLYRYLGSHHSYTVEKINDLDEVVELYLRPVDARMNFEPGEFVFMSVRGNNNISEAEHPFTMSSAPSKDYVRITYKVFGEYTKSLSQHLQIGDHIELYGPYGEFSSYVYDGYKKQIWISGGIGVAAFLSMLEYEAHNSDKKRIHFFYCNRNEKQSVYSEEIKKLSEESDDTITTTIKLSDVEGFPNAQMFKDELGDLKDHLIMMSGPPVMMHALAKGFKDLGVPDHMIVYEDFGFN